ncbi:MAG: uracil-DNA glycosylase family protein [Labrys sp. (in: a-proteobacteria)]|jgi:uracil-DNA glycosylase
MSPATAGPTISDLLDRIRACRLCRDGPTGAPLPHEPRPVLRVSASARILVAGQAPGTRVHASGLPFTDPSGDRLRRWMGIDAETFYDPARVAIVPMGFCFPGLDAKGGDLPPRPECVRTWHDALFAALPPFDLVIALGLHAQRYHFARLGLPVPASVAEAVAGWRATALRTAGPIVFPLPHPSWRNNGWLSKNSWFEDDVVPALRSAVRNGLQAA